MKIKLQANKDYWILTDEQKLSICNGCGGKGSILNKFIPAKKVFKTACNIHDYDYSIGETKLDKAKADTRFYINLQEIVNASPNCLVKMYRSILSNLYYKAVRDYGTKYFWQNKTVDMKNTEMKEVEI